MSAAENTADGRAVHTPGPWSVEAFGSPRVIAWQDDGGYMPICDIRGWGFLTGGGALGLPHEKAAAIQNANARLIAAAPDLLKYLNSFIEAIDSGSVEINSQEIDRGDGMQPHPWHKEWMHLVRVLLSHQGARS